MWVCKCLTICERCLNILLHSGNWQRNPNSLRFILILGNPYFSISKYKQNKIYIKN